MRPRAIYHFILFLLLASAATAAEPTPPPMKVADIIQQVKPRSKVLIQGTLIKALTLDVFVLNDGSADAVVDLTGLRHGLKAGDSIIGFGRFRGSSSYREYEAEFQILEFTDPSDEKATRALYEKTARQRTVLKKSPPPSAEAPAGPQRTIESRLEQLENLKRKGLITPAEYDEQRRRILGDL